MRGAMQGLRHSVRQLSVRTVQVAVLITKSATRHVSAVRRRCDVYMGTAEVGSGHERTHDCLSDAESTSEGIYLHPQRSAASQWPVEDSRTSWTSDDITRALDGQYPYPHPLTNTSFYNPHQSSMLATQSPAQRIFAPHDTPLYVGTTKPEATPLASVGTLTPTSPDTPMDDIRARFQRDGYVFMKGLISKDIVDKAREMYFESKHVQQQRGSGLTIAPTGIRHTGVLDSSRSISEGAFTRDPDASATFVTPGSSASGVGNFDAAKTEEYLQACIAAQRSDWFHAFSTTPQLVDFVKAFQEWDTPLLLKRQMLRAALPGQDGVPVHYDQLFFRHGPPTFLTCWTPLGPAGPEQGGLMYLSGSVALGEEMEADFMARAQHMTNEERKSAFNANMMGGGILHPDAGRFAGRLGRQWLVAEYEAGDVVFHNPHVIHASCVNAGEERRIMAHTDIRFVNPKEEFDERWMVYWTPADGL